MNNADGAAVVDAFYGSSKIKVIIGGETQTAEIGGYKILGCIEWNDVIDAYDFKKVAVLGKVRD